MAAVDGKDIKGNSVAVAQYIGKDQWSAADEKKTPASRVWDHKRGMYMPEGFAKTPPPPYYAVIFTSRRTDGDNGYEAMSQAIFELAMKQPGCLGAEHAREEGGIGITVAYFTDEAAISARKQKRAASCGATSRQRALVFAL
jgi:hypothetical protein